MTKPKQGNWGEERPNVPNGVWEAYSDPDPDWHWWNGSGYFVARLFDDGVESERIMAKVMFSRFIDKKKGAPR